MPGETGNPGMQDAMYFSYAGTKWALESLDNIDEPHSYLADYWINLWIERWVGKVESISDRFNNSNTLLMLVGLPMHEKIEDAAMRYFQLKSIAVIVGYISDSTEDERLQVFNELAVSRRALLNAVDEGFRKVSHSPEKWRRLRAAMRGEIEATLEDQKTRINSETSLLKSMRRAVLKDEPQTLRKAVITCDEKHEPMDWAKIDLLTVTFSPGSSVENVLNSEALSTYLSAETGYLSCMTDLALLPLVKDNERYQYLINSGLSIREVLQKSEILLAGGKDALAIDALTDLSEGYLASLRWNRQGSAQRHLIKERIDDFKGRWQRLLRSPGKRGLDEREKAFLRDLLAGLQKNFRQWNSEARLAMRTESAEASLVSDAALHLWSAEKLSRKWGGDYYCFRGDCARAALGEYKRAIEAEPLDWRGWLYFARAQIENNGPIISAAAAYDKALSLIDRCAGQVSALCPKMATGADSASRERISGIRLTAARLHLRLAHYARAAELYAEGLRGYKKEGPAQWGAVARYGAEGLDVARAQYRATAEKPEKFEKNGALEVMLRSGFVKLSEEAEKQGRLWDTYRHEQNIARLEAAGDILQRPRPYTTERLLNLYSRLTWRRHTWRGFDGTEIEPDMSLYGRSHARAAYKLARRGKFYKARRNFRLALATDPWWVYGAVELAYVDYELIGLCDAIPAAERALELMKEGTLGPASILNLDRPLRYSLSKWREQKEYADQHGTGYMAGYCDPDPDLPNRSIIRPDREVLIAPK